MEFVKWLFLGSAFAAVIAGVLAVVERASQSTVALLAGALGLVLGGLVFGGPILLIARRRIAQATLADSVASSRAATSPATFAYQPPTIIMPPAYAQPAAPSLPLFERGLDEVGAGARFYGAEPATYPASSLGTAGYTARELPPRVNWDVL